MKETQKMLNELHHRKYKEVKGIVEQYHKQKHLFCSYLTEEYVQFAVTVE